MKKFWVYILVAFGLGWILQGIGMVLGGMWFTLFNALCMFAPMAATLAATGSLKTEVSGIRWKLGLKSHKLRWWFAALWGFAALSIIGAALYYLIFPARFDGNMGALGAQVGSALPASVLALIVLLETVTVAPFINMFFAVGEETGWRGWMTPFLCQKLGRRKGLVVSGVIWGAWHWPIIILAGYNYGTGYWGAPFTGALMMCLACVGLGILLSFLYERTESIWAPALAHGAFNATASLGTVFLVSDATSCILGPIPLGLISGIPMFILAAWAFFGKRKAPAEIPADEIM